MIRQLGEEEEEEEEGWGIDVGRTCVKYVYFVSILSTRTCRDGAGSTVVDLAVTVTPAAVSR